jgi:hypothetical protein
MKPRAATMALMETVATTITAQTAAGSTAEGAVAMVVGEEAEMGAVVEAEPDPKLLPVEHSTYGRA